MARIKRARWNYGLNMETTDYLIIGAGQCGLSAARYLQKAEKDFIILDKHPDIGDSWRNRYSSLRLFTPAEYSQLPDLPMALPEPVRPTKDQMADYFSRYANHFGIQVQSQNEVTKLQKEGEYFIAKTSYEDIYAKQVIIANGCNKPTAPEWTKNLSIPYIHSSNYRTPVSIKGNRVLVVGAGNSAAQIIAELTPYFDVHWSIKDKLTMKPLYVLGKNVLWWGDKLNKLKKAPKEKQLHQTDPIYLYDDLKAKLKKAQQHGAVTAAGGNRITFEDQSSMEFDFILFATGFTSDYRFIDIEGFEGDASELRKQDGISAVDGLYFLGIPSQRSMSSHLIWGSQRDAEFIIQESLKKYTPA